MLIILFIVIFINFNYYFYVNHYFIIMIIIINFFLQRNIFFIIYNQTVIFNKLSLFNIGKIKINFRTTAARTQIFPDPNEAPNQPGPSPLYINKSTRT